MEFGLGHIIIIINRMSERTLLGNVCPENMYGVHYGFTPMNVESSYLFFEKIYYYSNYNSKNMKYSR